MDIYKHLKLTLSEDNETDTIVEEDSSILDLLKKANSELEKYYAGKYKFNISKSNKNDPDFKKIKLSPKKKRKIKEIWLSFDSELCKLQRNYNYFLKDTLDDK